MLLCAEPHKHIFCRLKCFGALPVQQLRRYETSISVPLVGHVNNLVEEGDRGRGTAVTPSPLHFPSPSLPGGDLKTFSLFFPCHCLFLGETMLTFCGSDLTRHLVYAATNEELRNLTKKFYTNKLTQVKL